MGKTRLPHPPEFKEEAESSCTATRGRVGRACGVLEYIECFHNPRRRHSSLGQTSPVEYEEATMKGAAVA